MVRINGIVFYKDVKYGKKVFGSIMPDTGDVVITTIDGTTHRLFIVKPTFSIRESEDGKRSRYVKLVTQGKSPFTPKRGKVVMKCLLDVVRSIGGDTERIDDSKYLASIVRDAKVERGVECAE